MQTAADELSDSYHQAIRTGIGETLRTLFVPMEPPPERLLELLHALDQPKGGENTKKRAAGANRPGDTPEKECVEKIPGGYVVRDANGQALMYVYCRANKSEALRAEVLTEDEAWRIAISIAKLQGLLKRED
jgi:hypothetical protein